MFVDYDEEYFEKAEENNSIIDQITEIAKGLAKKEIKEHIEYLTKRCKDLDERNKTLENFNVERINYESKIRSLEREYKLQYDRGYEDAKKEKLTKFLDIQRGYTIESRREFITKKCDKCDGDRRIHFKSPSGKDFEEPCSCSKTKLTYHICEAEAKCLILKNGNFKQVYFNRPSYYDETGERFTSCWDDIYISDKFHSVEELIQNNDGRYGRVVFATKEDAQKYIDWLNKRETE